MKLISPSLLSADFGNLQRDIEMLNASECDWLHVDVMDGIFVPNISFGQPIVKHIKKHAQKPLDVHLMIEDPGRYVQDFRDAGADILTIHYEACHHHDRVLHAIHDAGMKGGVVLNPSSPVCLLEDIVQLCDVVLLMSVNPGFGGQKFIENTYNKVRQLRELCNRKNPQCLIEVDGGVNLQNAPLLFEAGADVLVAGNAVFKSDNPQQTIHDETMKRPQLIIAPGKEKALLRRHPWIFSGAVKRIVGEPQEGDLVDVVDARGQWMATGHYQNESIICKVLSFDTPEVDEAFFRRRLRSAIAYRERLGFFLQETRADTNVFRLVHAEGDYLPGLVADWYNGVLVLQAHSEGMHRLFPMFAELFPSSCCPPTASKSIFDKSSATVPGGAADGYLWGDEPQEWEICEHGNRMLINFFEGQKTGFFIDQRENRALVQQLAKGHRVLNCFGYTGGFSLAALRGGAEYVETVDISKKAIDLCNRNVELNFGPDAPHQGTVADVLQYFKQSTIRQCTAIRLYHPRPSRFRQEPPFPPAGLERLPLHQPARHGSPSRRGTADDFQLQPGRQQGGLPDHGLHRRHERPPSRPHRAPAAPRHGPPRLHPSPRRRVFKRTAFAS